MATDTVVSLEEELDSLGHPIPLASLFRGCKCVHLRPARDHAEENAGDELDLQSLRDGYLHSLVCNPKQGLENLMPFFSALNIWQIGARAVRL